MLPIEGKRIILASGSPRRQKFMKDLNIPFEIRLKPVDESFPADLKKEEITNYLAILKSKPFLKDLKPDEILITSDTIVWLDDQALNKPQNEQEAVEMLQRISGKMHEVFTSICLTTTAQQIIDHDVTQVYFRPLADEEIHYYVQNYQPFDKAGGYGIQEWIGLIGVEKIVGSYFNVMGLPTEKLYTSLNKLK